jgi:ribosomal protein L24
VEASQITDVQTFFKGIAGVQCSLRGNLRIEVVPFAERLQLLEMPTFFPAPTKPGTWVRFKCRGLYHNDLGLILNADYDSGLQVTVGCVPRISLSLSRKRKRHGSVRPSAAPFNPETIARVYGVDSVVARNQAWFFKGKYYKNGLLDRLYLPNEITEKDVNPTIGELELFLSSGCELARECSERTLRSILDPVQVGQRIEVIAGELVGLRGQVVRIHDDGTLVFASDDQDEDIQVPIQHVSKLLKLGDYVQVVLGPHRGAEGYVVALSDNTAVIYQRRLISQLCNQREEPGEQVCGNFVAHFYLSIESCFLARG